MTAVDQHDSACTITAQATAPTAHCPRCGIASPRVHSYYTRRPRDLPLWDCAVRLVLHVRRFRCLNVTCTVQTFAERLPQVVRPTAQRTVRLTTVLQQLGLALGGEAGARLGATLHVPTSPDTRLRLVRQLPDPPMPTPATLGAPEAHQVLDRWHLVRHLREALERLLDRLHQRPAAMLTASQTTTALIPSIEARSHGRSTADQIARQARRARRLARYQEVRALHAQGVSTRHMARQLQMSRTTVSRYLRPDAFPERGQSQRVSLLNPYVAYLHKRWDAGCHHGVQRWRDMHALGFPGTRRMVSNWVVLRRELELGRPSAAGRRPALPKEPAVRLLPAAAAGMGHPLRAPRQLVWVLLRPEEALRPSDGEVLQALRHDKDLDTAYTLTQRFCQMMRERTASTLDRWLMDCQASGMPALVHFTSGLQREQPAVQAALTLPYSNRQVEGQITTLKLLKRQSYGRAKLDVLRQRMLHAA
jgi:transposase